MHRTAEPLSQAPVPAGTVDGACFAIPGFDAIARLLATRLGLPLVSLVLDDGSAFWYAEGDERQPNPGQILHPRYLEAARRPRTWVVTDTSADPAFAGVTLSGLPSQPVQFFACEPVYTLNGAHVGGLCVLDVRPRGDLNEDERTALRDAAELAGSGIVLRSYLGRTDPVTQLPHRNAFFEDLRERRQAGLTHSWLVAIEIAPVQRFNAFVRAMGHTYADALVRAVAARAQAWLPEGTHLYQVGATRFAALLPTDTPMLQPAQLDALVAELRDPFDCQDIPLTIQPGVGLLDLELGTPAGSDPLRLVMTASYVAQRSARGWALYQHEQDERHRRDFFLVTELAAALSDRSGRSELSLCYQPRVRLVDGRCTSLEALLRWQHPTLGAVPPGQFIGLAEQAGLMRSLTGWVLDHAVAQLAAWRRAGHLIGLSVNVSNADFGADLVTRVEAVTARHGLDPAVLELEFTESTLMQHNDATRGRLEAIRALGCDIAIDDFGTGYSNLNALRKMPATHLKIDQSFVRSMDASRHDAAIVRAVAELAHDLGFRVVVEGVENAGIFEQIRQMPCDEVQGFHFARPMPAGAVAEWLVRHHATAGPAGH